VKLGVSWTPWALRVMKRLPGRRGPGGRRGRIRGFSAASRRRLRALMASLDYSGLGKSIFWVTLTARPSDNERFFDFFKRLKRLFIKYWPLSGMIWRLEQQKRGVVHFHLLLFAATSATADWVVRQWLKYWAGDAERVAQKVKVVRSLAGIAAYISDMGKVDQEYCGVGHRHWGRVGKLPFYVPVTFYSVDAYFQIRRLLRRLAVARFRRRGRRVKLRRWFATDFLEFKLEYLCALL